QYPVTLSPTFLRKLLRDELRYRHVVISDDLDMKALTNNYDRKDIPVLALQAGCDMLLYCNDPTSPPIGLEAVRAALSDGRLSVNDISASLKRVEALKAD